MKKYWGVAVLLGIGLWLPARLRAAEVSDDTDLGWSPALASRWTEAQMNYAQAVKKYGEASPEATQAQVEMNTLARKLGIKPTNEVPQSAPLKKPIEVAVESESEEKQVTTGPALNSPAPENVNAEVQP